MSASSENVLFVRLVSSSGEGVLLNVRDISSVRETGHIVVITLKTNEPPVRVLTPFAELVSGIVALPGVKCHALKSCG